MKVRVKFMLWLRDRVSVSETVVGIDSGFKLSDLLEISVNMIPSLRDHISGVFKNMESRVSVLVNGVNVYSNVELKDGDIVVFIQCLVGRVLGSTAYNM